MTKKPKKVKPKKRIPEGVILMDKEYWEKLAEEGCKDGTCEIKLK
jgi:hypothetical protein